MIKIDTQTKADIKGGNIKVLKETLETERERLRTFLEQCAESKVKETQGMCQILSNLIQLLP